MRVQKGSGEAMKMMFTFGTRPEFIKLWPVIREADERGIRVITVNTGQHREMLDEVMRRFSFVPDHNLMLMRKNQTLEWITAEAIRRVSEVVKKHKPDVMVVQGDTVSCFAGALAAFYNKVPVAHVEAGLRSFNPYSPYPEEMMRVLTSRLATFHFCPTETGRTNLIEEGIRSSRIFVTGNTVIDILKSVIKPDYEFSPEVSRILGRGRRVILLTTHRRENQQSGGMVNIMRAVDHIARKYDDVDVIFPMHMSPNVRKIAASWITAPNVHMIEPLEYVEFANLMSRVYLILTDSGGIQEEAPALNKPVLVLRKETERQEAISSGAAMLVGTDYDAIIDATEKLLKDVDGIYRRMADARSPYGDGRASERIVSTLLASKNFTDTY